MGKSRIEACSDGVIAIIYVGIYWNKLQYANNPYRDRR
jgi:hypothetical protein